MINLETASREELLAYIEQQKSQTNKRINKNTALKEELTTLFNKYSDNNPDNLFKLYFLLNVLYSNIQIPILELLENMDYCPEEEDVRKVVITIVKELAKSDEFKLRKHNKKNVATAEVKVEENTPL